jgi:hypothetical protein
MGKYAIGAAAPTITQMCEWRSRLALIIAWIFENSDSTSGYRSNAVACVPQSSSMVTLRWCSRWYWHASLGGLV